jgi:hypothetical protein
MKKFVSIGCIIVSVGCIAATLFSSDAMLVQLFKALAVVSLLLAMKFLQQASTTTLES